jgi:hypothetical protein
MRTCFDHCFAVRNPIAGSQNRLNEFVHKDTKLKEDNDIQYKFLLQNFRPPGRPVAPDFIFCLRLVTLPDGIFPENGQTRTDSKLSDLSHQR